MKKMMRVSDLKNLLKAAPDNAFVVVEDGMDHEYRSAEATITTALYDKKSGIFTEDIYVGDVGEDTEYGIRVPVVLII